MKTYEKIQYSGNENGWHEPTQSLGKTSINEAHASEMNSHFRNTGIKYVESSKVGDNVEATTNEADHGEHNLMVKDGKLQTTKNKPAEKAKEQQKEKERDDKEAKAHTASDAKPGDKDAFVKSDGTVKHAEHKEDNHKQDNLNSTAGN